MDKNKNYLQGIKDGIPIAMGYFAVAFTLGIAAKDMGMTIAQSGLMSFMLHASAGQFAAMTVIAEQAGYIAMIGAMFVINIRYFLMSCALSQKLNPNTPLWQRMLMSYFVTDEIFGISISVKGDLNPFYPLGAMSVGSPAWLIGTMLGCAVGNILPVSLSSAFGVALYGMFIAVIIPPSKESRTIAIVVIISMIASAVSTVMPILSTMSSGTKIIILTLVIASAAAIIKPVQPESLLKEEVSEDA
jgi:predicted branched-subunit amino acid permease